MVSGMVQWYQGVLVSTSCIGAGILVCDLQWKFGFGSGQGCHASASSYRPGLDSPEAASSGRLCDLKRVGFKGHMTPIRPSFGSCNKVQSLNLSSASGNTNSGLGSPWSMHDKKLSHRGTLSKLEEGHFDKKISARDNPPTASASRKPPTFSHPKFQTSPTSPDLQHTSHSLPRSNFNTSTHHGQEAHQTRGRGPRHR